MPEDHACWTSLAALHERTPTVHNVTNLVAMDLSANLLLAVGASPLMAHAIDEVGEVVELADALVVNIGTPSRSWLRGMVAAARRAGARGIPWVLDPVGAGATTFRTAAARDLSRRGPSVVRGNASEILALAGEDAVPRGVDAMHRQEEAAGAADELARALGSVVAVTGEVDRVTDGERARLVPHGHPLLTRVTATGCALSALVAAFLAVHPDPLEAAARALAVFGVAGEMAARDAPGPGSFRTSLLDSLAGLPGDDPPQTRIEEGSVS